MPILLAALIGALETAVVSFVGRVLLAMFLGFVTYVGFQAALDWAMGQIHSAVGGLPAAAIQIFALTWADKAISMVASATAGAMIVRGIRNGALTKMSFKAPA